MIVPQGCSYRTQNENTEATHYRKLNVDTEIRHLRTISAYLQNVQANNSMTVYIAMINASFEGYL